MPCPAADELPRNSVLGISIVLNLYLRICCEKVSFCSGVSRIEGKPGGCRASFSHSVSREKQFLFILKSTSANCSIRLRETPPPIPWKMAILYDCGRVLVNITDTMEVDQENDNF